MQKVNDSYAGLSYQEIYEVWSAKAISSGYKPHELEQIHKRWKSLGKKIAQGPAVRLDTRRRRG
jgi:hypothetical protein